MDPEEVEEEQRQTELPQTPPKVETEHFMVPAAEAEDTAESEHRVSL